jgi:hypothetical protein
MEHISTKRTDAARAKDARKIATNERKRKREDNRILQIQKRKENVKKRRRIEQERKLIGLILQHMVGGMTYKLA